MNSDSGNTHSLNFSLDDVIQVIDGLFSSGWTSYFDINIALHKLHRSILSSSTKRLTAEEEEVLNIDPSILSEDDYIRRIMDSSLNYTGRIKHYYYRMSEVWTKVHQGVQNKYCINLIIENQAVNRINCESYSLRRSTELYLKKRGVSTLNVYRYKDRNYSIKEDLAFYKGHYDRADTVIEYDGRSTDKFGVVIEPDVVARKISALKIQALKDALLRDTNEAVSRRLAEIEYLTRTKPDGWGERTINLYLNAIYDASTVYESRELEPIIQQLRSHMLNHFSSGFFPADSLSVVIDYKKYCPWKAYPKIARSLAPLSRIITQDEFSSEDIDIIRDRCWLALCKFDYLDDAQFDKVAPLYDAISFLMNSTTYVYNMSGVSAALTLYRIDSDIDLNTIVSTMNGLVKCLIHDFTNDYADYFKSAEEAYLSKCKSIISSLNREVARERFIIGLVEITSSFITRSIPRPLSDIIPDATIMEGMKELNNEEREHFNELYHTLRFEENYQTFVSSASRDVLSKHTQGAFVHMISHLLINLITGTIWLEKESYHHQKLLSELKEFESKVSCDERCTLFNGFRLLVKYSLVVIDYNPFPMDIRDGCTPQICKELLNTIINDTKQFQYNENEMQLLLLLCSAIALRHVDYFVPKEDDEEEKEYNAGIKEKAIEFLPVAKSFVNLMTSGQIKEDMVETLSTAATRGFYNGFIL